MHDTVTRLPDRSPPRAIARAPRIALALSGLLLAVAMCGCAEQVRWYPDYPQGEKVALAETRPMLLYFWDWLSPDTARLDMQVLPDPRVTAAMRRTVNVRLEAGWFRDLARRYDVLKTPMFILTDPNGVEQARLGGVPTPQNFVAWLEESLRPRGATQPAGPATQPMSAQPAAPAPDTQPMSHPL
jgi:hypothetical protein